MSVFRKIGCCMTAVAAIVLTACSQIDEDLSDCQPEPQAQVDYELRLVTNMTTELQTQLNTVTDVLVADALRKHLQGIFREFAHDVDLSFYDTAGDSVRLHHESHIMDDNQSSYTINLPRREYVHLAAANIADNSLVAMRNAERYHTHRLNQLAGDTLNSHETGLFTARHYMDVKGNVSQTFNVKLYMANCAAALVVDTTGVDYRNIRVYARGFATDFLAGDSAYVYANRSPYIRASAVDVEEGSDKIAFCSVSFPSRNPGGWWIKEKEEAISTRAEGEIIPEGEGEEYDVPIWEFVALVTLNDGSVTRTVLSVSVPLLAGALKVICGKMTPLGEIRTSDMCVAVSVAIDWRPGNTYETPL